MQIKLLVCLAKHRPAPVVAAPSKPPTPAKIEPTRSDAITLLAVLQREARLVDFLKENISGYDNAQVGAAVRDVHRDASAAIERVFALRPVFDQPEGSDVSLPARFDAGRIRLIGNVGATPPAKGKLQHGGWQATKPNCRNLPAYPTPRRLSRPAELEV